MMSEADGDLEDGRNPLPYRPRAPKIGKLPKHTAIEESDGGESSEAGMAGVKRHHQRPAASFHHQLATHDPGYFRKDSRTPEEHSTNHAPLDALEPPPLATTRPPEASSSGDHLAATTVNNSVHIDATTVTNSVHIAATTVSNSVRIVTSNAIVNNNVDRAGTSTTISNNVDRAGTSTTISNNVDRAGTSTTISNDVLLAGTITNVATADSETCPNDVNREISLKDTTYSCATTNSSGNITVPCSNATSNSSGVLKPTTYSNTNNSNGSIEGSSCARTHSGKDVCSSAPTKASSDTTIPDSSNSRSTLNTSNSSSSNTCGTLDTSSSSPNTCSTLETSSSSTNTYSTLDTCSTSVSDRTLDISGSSCTSRTPDTPASPSTSRFSVTTQNVHNCVPKPSTFGPTVTDENRSDGECKVGDKSVTDNLADSAARLPISAASQGDSGSAVDSERGTTNVSETPKAVCDEKAAPTISKIQEIPVPVLVGEFPTTIAIPTPTSSGWSFMEHKPGRSVCEELRQLSRVNSLVERGSLANIRSNSVDENGPYASSQNCSSGGTCVSARRGTHIAKLIQSKSVNMGERPIYPNVPFSPYGSPCSSPRLRRRPLKESRCVSIEKNGEYVQLNQYKLKEAIGQ
ncbi:hypothetical protein OTU49_010824, partial [Cherax quadricarinatus]